ncbi:MAG: hypothetical protein JW867_05520 [Candidatus Omnitrophica bacterium]|nr:hypothetical protein [Candidatus Omnitrophota bacterium]
MKKLNNKTNKAQSIMEYLTVLTAIVVVIIAHTFAHFGNIRPGQMIPDQAGSDPLAVNRALRNLHQDLNQTIHQDYSGETPDLQETEQDWYDENPIPMQ